MGVHFKDLKFIEEIIDYLEVDVGGVCVMGDLWIRNDMHNRTRHRVLKTYLEVQLGIKYVDVIDLGIGSEAVCDYVLRYDLAEPLPESLGLYGMIIDVGTAEHIDNQYMYFRNIHNLCDVGSIVIMINASDNYGAGYSGSHHGKFHYTWKFYGKLAIAAGYRLVDVRETPQKYWVNMQLPKRKCCTYVAYMRDTDAEFISPEKFAEIAVELGDYR